MSLLSDLNSEFDALEQLLGYLNFLPVPRSSILSNLNVVWKHLAAKYPDDTGLTSMTLTMQLLITQ